MLCQLKIDEVNRRLATADLVFSVSTRGRTVKQIETLRRQLPKGASTMLIKNTLMARCACNTVARGVIPSLGPRPARGNSVGYTLASKCPVLPLPSSCVRALVYTRTPQRLYPFFPVVVGVVGAKGRARMRRGRG